MSKAAIEIIQLEPLALRPKDAARFIGVSERTFHSMKACGQLPPAVKLGGCVLYPVEDLRWWLAWNCPTIGRFNKLKQETEKKK